MFSLGGHHEGGIRCPGNRRGLGSQRLLGWVQSKLGGLDGSREEGKEGKECRIAEAGYPDHGKCKLWCGEDMGKAEGHVGCRAAPMVQGSQVQRAIEVHAQRHTARVHEFFGHPNEPPDREGELGKECIQSEAWSFVWLRQGSLRANQHGPGHELCIRSYCV